MYTVNSVLLLLRLKQFLCVCVSREYYDLDISGRKCVKSKKKNSFANEGM